jgi:hypothetical protein
MAIIKMSDTIEELQAVRVKVDLDIARQRSRDTGGEDGKTWFCTYTMIMDLHHDK